MDSKKLALLCRKHAEEKKAENIAVLDVRKLSTVTDFFVVISASSEPHMRAVADEIADKIREESGIKPSTVDGTLRTSWMVMDYGDVIVHIMRSNARAHYDLEGLWGDAPRVKGRRPRTPKGAADSAAA